MPHSKLKKVAGKVGGKIKKVAGSKANPPGYGFSKTIKQLRKK